MSIVAALLLTTVVSAPVPAEERLLVCQLRLADLAKVDPVERDKVFPTGPNRLLVMKFPAIAVGVDLKGDQVQIHDPSGILLGRTLDYIGRSDGEITYAAFAVGPKDDTLTLVVGEVEPGKISRQSYVIRAVKGETLNYMLLGRCAFQDTNDPDQAFSVWQKQPATIE